MSRRGWLLFVALCIVWGIPYMFTRIAVREIAPPTLVFLRTLPAALLLAPLALQRRITASDPQLAILFAAVVESYLANRYSARPGDLRQLREAIAKLP